MDITTVIQVEKHFALNYSNFFIMVQSTNSNIEYKYSHYILPAVFNERRFQINSIIISEKLINRINRILISSFPRTLTFFVILFFMHPKCRLKLSSKGPYYSYFKFNN
jgi:hypothetical protein